MSLNAAIEAELPGLRAQAEARMTSTCTIKREGGSTVDGAGFEVEGWTVIHADLPLRLAGSERGGSGTRAVSSGGVDVQLAVRTAHVPATTTGLRDGDVIEVTEGENAGTFLRIIEAASQDQATALRLPVIEAQEPEGWSA